MASSPVSTAIGVGAVGVGVLLMYAAYKNLDVFGPEGIVSRVIRGEKLSTAAGKAGKLAGDDGKVGSGVIEDNPDTGNSATESHKDFPIPPGA